jgi:hypothetical protein
MRILRAKVFQCAHDKDQRGNESGPYSSLNSIVSMAYIGEKLNIEYMNIYVNRINVFFRLFKGILFLGPTTTSYLYIFFNSPQKGHSFTSLIMSLWVLMILLQQLFVLAQSSLPFFIQRRSYFARPAPGQQPDWASPSPIKGRG